MTDVKSPQEIEEGIESTKTVTWDPFNVLPKEIYLEIFEKLDSSVDKQNFMNAHVKFYHLFKSKRTLFMCPQVFKELNRYEEKNWLYLRSFEGRVGYKSYLKCRLVCHDWDKGVQKVFQLHEHYFKLEEGNDVWPGELPVYLYENNDWEPCNSFVWIRTEKLKDDLEMFAVTHPPTKNPFFSRSICIYPFPDDPFDDEGFTPEELERFRDEVDTLLERYGRHFWHCTMDIDKKLNHATCLRIAKWMNLMPELKTLYLKYDQEESDPFSKEDLREIEDMQVLQPEMENLLVLKSLYIPCQVFNKLFGSLPQLEKIQIKIFKGEVSFIRNFRFMMDRENLKEAFLTIKGFDDFECLQGTEPFHALKKLVISLEYVEDDEREYQAYSKWPEWKMILEILEKKFPSLEHLNMKLPKAYWNAEKRAVIQQSWECRLNLPKLKKLWIALPNLSCIDFLLPCKDLKELTVVLEHTEWYSRKSYDLGRSEVVNLNMDLRNMWESNVWNLFPKLSKLEIKALPDDESEVLDSRIYEKCGDQRKFYVEMF